MSAAQPILKKAQSVLHQPFSRTYADQTGGQHLEAYCAAFVRWCYRATGKPLPVVAKPEFYRHLGLSFTAGENTADSLSGKTVGDVVAKNMRAGDILLFRNTYGNWPYGTITHVGIASDSAGMMYDAGSGSIVHHRLIEQTFPKLLVEVRRPTLLGGDTSKPTSAATGLPHRVEDGATRIHYQDGHLSAKRQGHPVRDLTVVLYADGRCLVNGHMVQAGLVSLVIHDISGKVYKMHKHDGHSMMTEGVKTIAMELTNGLLQVGYAAANGRGASPGGGSGSSGSDHDRPSAIGSMTGTAMSGSGGGSGASATKVGRSPSTAAKILHTLGGIADHASSALAKKIGMQLEPLKPTSVELTVLH